jgi:hypothetical protein
MGWWRGRYRRLGIDEGFGKGMVGLLLFLGYGGTVAVLERGPWLKWFLVAMAMIFERRE